MKPLIRLCWCSSFLVYFLSTIQCHVLRYGTKLVIDHDGGADDAMAIFIALLREQYFGGHPLLAISTVHGNVNETQAFENTQRILDVANRQDVAIFRGSEKAIVIDGPKDHFFGIDGLGDNQNADYNSIMARPGHSVLALLRLSELYEGELVIVAIGPLTNIALAIKLDPRFLDRLKHLYIGGGNVYSESFPRPEFNALLDIEAYYIVVNSASPDKVTIVPFSEMVLSMPIPADWRRNELGAIKTAKMNAQNEYERVSLPKGDTWEFLDPVVLSIAEDHNVIAERRLSSNNITLSGPNRGICTNDFESDKPNVNLMTAGNEEYYKQFLLDTFSAEIFKYYSIKIPDFIGIPFTDINDQFTINN